MAKADIPQITLNRPASEDNEIIKTDTSTKFDVISDDSRSESAASSLSSSSSRISSSASIDSTTLSKEEEKDEEDNLNYCASNLLKSASSASLAALASKIPSHQHFKKLVHKHEVPRKVLHVSIGFLTLWLYTVGVNLSQVTPVLTVLLIGLGSCDFIRFKNEEFNRLYCKYVGFLMREKEVNAINGVIWYLVGLIIVFLIFPKDLSLLAVLLLSWADTAASTFGRAFGHLTPKLGGKSVAGTLSAFIISFFSAWLLYAVFIPFWDYNNQPGEIMWTPETSKVGYFTIAIVSGFVGAGSEAIDVFDDNLTIPVLSSVLMWCFIKLANNGLTYESAVFAF